MQIMNEKHLLTSVKENNAHSWDKREYLKKENSKTSPQKCVFCVCFGRHREAGDSLSESLLVCAQPETTFPALTWTLARKYRNRARPALTFTTLMEQITSDELDVFSWRNYKILETGMTVDATYVYFSKILDIIFPWHLPSKRNSKWFGNDRCHLCFEGSYGVVSKGEWWTIQWNSVSPRWWNKQWGWEGWTPECLMHGERQRGEKAQVVWNNDFKHNEKQTNSKNNLKRQNQR